MSQNPVKNYPSFPPARRPQPFNPHSVQTPTEKETKKPRRQLAEQIKAFLVAGTPVAKIAETLGCDRRVVYWHKNKGKRKKNRDSLEDKVVRFNRKYPNSGLTAELVELATDMVCSFSGEQIDAEKQSFCLGLQDGAPIVYLPEYKVLTKLGGKVHLERCRKILERNGFEVKEIEKTPNGS